MNRLALAALLAALAGCQTPPASEGAPDPQARYLQRDLTTAWAARRYWRGPPVATARPAALSAESPPAPEPSPASPSPSPARPDVAPSLAPEPATATAGAPPAPARRTACAKGSC
ncbi:MAG: hypothetical protein IPK64_22055 [bacterium]|nr:hypothetical protein [bacterium]